MNKIIQYPGSFFEGAPEDPSKNTAGTNMISRRRAVLTGIFAVIAGVVAVCTKENLESIQKKNIPLSEDLSCDLTVNFRDRIPSITVRINDLPPNPNGTKNFINLILHLRMRDTPEHGVEYFLRTTTTASFGMDPQQEDIELISNKLGDRETENSASDYAAALKKFATLDLEPYLDIETMTDGEVAPLARRIVYLSLAEFEAKQLASALAENSEELSK